MSLLKLKSIFSPTNTKFEKSDLTTFSRQFDNDFQQTNLQNLDSIYDNGLNVPIKSNLQNLDSKFDDGITPITNTPQKTTQNPDTFNLRSLRNLKSVFQGELQQRTEDFISIILNSGFNFSIIFAIYLASI